MRRLVLFTLLLGPPALPAADVAVREDGSRVPGRLELARSGRLVFVPQRRDASVSDAVEYRLDGQPSPFRAGPGMLLRLPGGQQLSGLFLGLEREALLFRTAWADRLLVPRQAVVSLTHLPGRHPLFAHDLTGKLTGWAVQGAPAVSPTGTVLAKAGQALSFTLTRPVATGRVEVNFRAQGQPAGARWVVETLFARKGGDREVRVTLAGTGELKADTGGLAGTAERLPHAEGWRRLYIEFGPGSLRLSVDDEALWYTLAAGPGGPLRQVRLACLAADRPVVGSVELARFVVERDAAQRPHPPGDSTQDELWLGDGDQLFGQVVRADRQGIELKGRFGVRRYAWTALRGWFPRKGKAARGLGAPAVRLGVRSGLRAEVDVLEGTLTGLDGRRLTLAHAVLGDVTLERARVAWVRPVVR